MFTLDQVETFFVSIENSNEPWNLAAPLVKLKPAM